MLRLIAFLCVGLVASVRPQVGSPLHTAVFKGHLGAIAPLADEEDVNGLEEGQTPCNHSGTCLLQGFHDRRPLAL